ncbi:ATP-binding protein [Intrasporangium calvum]|uniref:ATP-binding protein n=1 Tax=Intrasporangium calvum TaxID=53358 RepID=UPI003B587279
MTGLPRRLRRRVGPETPFNGHSRPPNLPFSGWGGVFGDQAVATAMIDRVVHHADVLTLKGASYRLRNRGIDTLPSIRTQGTAD